MEILKLYDDFEDCEKLHVTLGCVLDADKAISGIVSNMEGVGMLDVDKAIGDAIRAYEQQGFVYGFNMARYMLHLLNDWDENNMTANGQNVN